MQPMKPAQPPELNLTVWYDGACPLCSREIAAMRRLDRKRAIAFVDIADPAQPCPVDRTEALARFHVTEGERILSGALAFAAMWRAIPSLRWLGLLARVRLVEHVLERCYRVFLLIRPTLQRLMK